MIDRVSHDDGEVLRCPGCGWSTTWGAYRRRCTRRQLNEGGAGHEFHDYLVRRHRTGETASIHGRSVAVHLIEGKLGDVIAFLEELAGTAPRMRELATTSATWRERLKEAWKGDEWKEWKIVGPAR